MSNQEKKSGLKGWSTRDLLVTAVISITFGLLTIGVTYISTALIAINPAFISVLAGFYYIPMIMAMYIIRRPGAVVLTAAIGRLVTTIFNPFGWMVALVNIFIAIFYELPFLLTRYRDFRLRILLSSGAVGGLLGFASVFAFGGLNSLTPLVQVISLGLFIASGALGGWLAKALADALAKTGVLSGFPIAAEQMDEI